MRKSMVRLAVTLIFAALPNHGTAQSDIESPNVYMVYMGGNDCPPCVAWRQFELPKLKQSVEFKAVRFFHVTKTIKSSVPPGFFLPPEVRPYKEKLDVASGGYGGSPQTAIIIDGEIFDYFYGTRRAEEIVAMLTAIRINTKYPFERCTKRGVALYACDTKG